MDPIADFLTRIRNANLAHHESVEAPASKMKKDIETMLMWQMGRLFKIKTPCFICFEWHEKTTRRDKDNVAFAKKFILDAMQKAEKLANDNNRCLIGFTDTFVYDKQYGVNLTIWEDGDGNKSI